MEHMILVIGLGNPGKKYKNTRHNLGFRIVDEFREKNNFPKFKLSKKFNSLISESFVDGKKVILVKPRTFMNESGKSVKSLTNFYKSTRSGLVTKPDFVVIHDDIDLPLGKIRIVKNRGAAGHKGVESIIKEIGTKNFVRFRVGIKRTKGTRQNTKFLAGFVLQKLKKDEEKIIKETIEKTIEAIELFLKKGLEKAMSEYNR